MKGVWCNVMIVTIIWTLLIAAVLAAESLNNKGKK